MADPWDQPLPFIENIDGKLRVNKGTARRLNLIEKPMVIVCVAGLYRTGKSYLMNRLAGKTSGFSLGSTVESHTKGIWVWHVDHPLDPNKSLLIMDTEGLGDAFKGDKTYDVWICCLAVLLSSVFVYNIMGKIENQVIDELVFVTEMSRHIRARTNSTCDVEFDEFFPNFILAIRDFFLVPKIKGKDVTADEYMEQMMLTMKQSTRENDIKRNQIKKKIRSYFKNRKCFFFARPTMNDKDLRHVEDILDEDLQKDFVDCSRQFCDHIYTTASVKKIDPRQVVVGRVFTQLAELYVNAIDAGTVPCIESAIAQIAHKENNQALQESHSFYVKMMEELLSLPVTNEQLMLIHENCYKQAVDLFLKKVFFDKSKEYHAQLQESLANECLKYQEKNSKASVEKCQQILRKLFLPVDEKIHSQKYITGGGLKHYEEDITNIEIQYKSIPEKGIMAEVVWLETLKQRKTEREVILQADKNLVEQEKRIQIEKAKKEEAEKEAEIQKQNLELMRKQQDALRKAHEEHLKSLNDTYLKQMDIQHENYLKLMKSREEEMERLMTENFDKEANVLREQINTLEQQQPNLVSRIFGSLTNIGGLALTFLPHPAFKVAGLGLSVISQFFHR